MACPKNQRGFTKKKAARAASRRNNGKHRINCFINGRTFKLADGSTLQIVAPTIEGQVRATVYQQRPPQKRD